MALEVGAGIGQQGEAGGVRLGKTVEREGGDRLHDLILRRAGDAVALHAAAQLVFHLPHARLRAPEAEGAAQLFGLASSEPGGDHGHAQQLLLEERHAQRAGQHRLQRSMRVAHRLAPLPPLQVGIHHAPHDGSRADDGHFHHDVVKIPRTQARQAGHLRPALHLEHAHGVGFLERAVDGGIVRRQVRQVHLLAVACADELERVPQRCHHPQPQQVHLDDAQVGAVFLVPLHHHAAGHGGGLERHHRVQLAFGDHHAAGVLAQVARQVLHGQEKVKELSYARMAELETGFAELARGGVAGVLVLPGTHQARQAVERGRVKAQRLTHLPRRRAPAVGDDVGGHGRAPLAVAPVDVLDHALARLAAGQVEVDVRPLAALFGEEALEEQVHPYRIHGRDAQRVADGAVGG